MTKKAPGPDLEGAKTRVTANLPRLYGSTTASELVTALDLIDTTLLHTVTEEVTEYLISTHPNAKRSSQPGVVVCGDSFFEITTGQRDLVSPSALAVVVLRVQGPRHLRLVRAKGRLTGCSRFETITAIIDPELGGCVDAVLGLAQATLDSGYAWLLEFVRTQIRSLESALALKLYGYSRQMLSNDLARWLWFVVIWPQTGGVYLFDRISADAALDALTEERGATSESPAALFGHLLTTAVPFDQMFSRTVIETGECLDVQLVTAAYRDSASGYAVAEDVLYTPKVATLYPVVREGLAFLLAVFPADRRDSILPVLQEHQQELRRFLRRTDFWCVNCC
jgi:hypothetical protein